MPRPAAGSADRRVRPPRMSPGVGLSLVHRLASLDLRVDRARGARARSCRPRSGRPATASASPSAAASSATRRCARSPGLRSRRPRRSCSSLPTMRPRRSSSAACVRFAARSRSPRAKPPPDTFFAWDWEDDGTLSVRGRLAADEGALLIEAMHHGHHLRPRRQALPRLDGPSQVPRASETPTRSRRSPRPRSRRAPGRPAAAIATRSCCTSTLPGAASSKRARGSASTAPGGCSATRRWIRVQSTNRTGLVSRVGAPRPGRSRAPCGGRCGRATAAVASRDAGTGASSMHTTSSTGPTGARPRPTTSSSSVAATIG